MRNYVIFMILMSVFFFSSCSGATMTNTVTITDTIQEKAVESGPFTKTVTVQNTVTSISQGITKIATMPGNITPEFDREPPEIPHAIFFTLPGMKYEPGDKPFCFECHPIPPLHKGWLSDTELCEECHYMSDMPYLDE